MDYVEGEDLGRRLKRTGQPLKEADVVDILRQLLDALQTIHSDKLWHLDLKPANIMMNNWGQVKIIDFGSSKQFDAQSGGATSSTEISYTKGYAPREQMEENYEKIGPWTDFYALGASLYNLLTARHPPMPTDIDDDVTDDKHVALPMPNVSENMKKLILSLMQTNRMKRPKSVKEVFEELCTSQAEEINGTQVDAEETIIATIVNNATNDEDRDNGQLVNEEAISTVCSKKTSSVDIHDVSSQERITESTTHQEKTKTPIIILYVLSFLAINALLVFHFNYNYVDWFIDEEVIIGWSVGGFATFAILYYCLFIYNPNKEKESEI